MPVSLTKDWNLITRPVMTLYQSVPQPVASGGIARTTAFGDMILAQVFSPAHTDPWISTVPGFVDALRASGLMLDPAGL